MACIVAVCRFSTSPSGSCTAGQERSWSTPERRWPRPTPSRPTSREIAGSTVSHIVLTHNHFDHILGSSAFADAEVYCAPEVAATIADRTEHLRADAVRYGADPDEVARAVAALRVPEHPVRQAEIDLGEQDRW